MTPQDLIRAAAKIIETEGWCSGTDNKGKIVHVRDQSGIPLPLYRGDNTGQDKAKVNSGARSFSIYGALCKALHDARGAVADPGGMWTVLQGLALTEGPTTERMGGTNWVHPVIAFNEREGMTKDGVLAFLERCAVEFDAPFVVEMPEPTENTSDLVAMAGEDEDLFDSPVTDPADLGLAIVPPAVMEALRGVAGEGQAGTMAGAVEPEPAAMTHTDVAAGKTVATAVKAPVASPKAEPAVEAVKATLPPINWGES